MSELIKQIKPVFEEKVSPIVQILNKINITPNFLTLTGVFLIGIGSYFLYQGNYILAGILLTLGNLCDALDGTLARKFGKSSKFGAFLDSVVDRVSDFLPLSALALLYRDNFIYLTLILIAIVSSFMVSYTRARGEGLGIKCNIGILERPERSIILITFIFLNIPILAVIIIAFGSLITTLQRVYCVYKNTKN